MTGVGEQQIARLIGRGKDGPVRRLWRNCATACVCKGDETEGLIDSMTDAVVATGLGLGPGKGETRRICVATGSDGTHKTPLLRDAESLRGHIGKAASSRPSPGDMWRRVAWHNRE